MSDEVDQLLDRALSECAVPIPLGLESRVVQRVRRSRTKRRLLTWFGSLASVAAALLLAVRPPVRQAPADLRNSTLIVPAQIKVVPLSIKSTALRESKKPRRGLLPKRAVLLSSSPLSAEERALIDMTRRFPTETSRVFEQVQRSNEGPISIEPLAITPLIETPISGEQQ